MWRSIIFMFFGVLIIGASVFAAAIVTADTTGGSTSGYEFGWQIDTFDATYEIQDDGSILVTEVIDVDFNNLSKHGIFRDLVTKQRCAPSNDEEAALCPDGRRREYAITGFEVSDGSGAKIPASKESITNGIRFKIGDADKFVPSNIQYNISYTLEHALNSLAEEDELYWNITGEWPVPIVEARTTVIVPGGGEFTDFACYFGYRGSTDACLADANGDTARFLAEDLDANHQMTISAIFPAGLVPTPEFVTEDIRTFSDFFTFSILEFVLTGLVGAVTIAGVVFAWWRKGRDRRYTSIHYLTQTTETEIQPLFADNDIVVEFLPPDNIRPGEMGTLIKESASARDVSATVVDLAVRGYMVIEEDEKKRGKDWTFRKVRDADEKLLPYEADLFNAIFKGSREEVKVSALRNTFATDFGAAKKGMMDAAMERHWFPHRPEIARGLWTAYGFVMTAVGSGLAFILGFLYHQYFIALPIAIAGVLMLGFSAHMSRRTATGREALRRTLGFELYVSTAETRMQDFNEQQNIFARYLPYAIAFDCVDKWAKAFKGLENNPQAAGVSSWYYGGAAFSAVAFSDNMNSFSNSVSSSFASTPGGSGGSGGGGGGFSGGGGGGGGGGSW